MTRKERLERVALIFVLLALAFGCIGQLAQFALDIMAAL